MEFNQKAQLIWIPFWFTNTLMESWLMQSNISVWGDILDQFKPLVMKITRRINGWLIVKSGSMKLLWISELIRVPKIPEWFRAGFYAEKSLCTPLGRICWTTQLKWLCYVWAFSTSKDGGAPVDELGRLPLWFHSHFQFESPSTTSAVVEGTSGWLWNSSCGSELHNV